MLSGDFCAWFFSLTLLGGLLSATARQTVYVDVQVVDVIFLKQRAAAHPLLYPHDLLSAASYNMSTACV
jgi:hypothetical protein